MTKEMTLPERLRILADGHERFGIPKENWAPDIRVLREAADEIERLRSAIQILRMRPIDAWSIGAQTLASSAPEPQVTK